MMNEPGLFADVALEVSDFVALLNQTLDYSYPEVTIRGELANFRVSKNKWVYFDLKDQSAAVKFFGTVYQLNGVLEDGMILRVRGTPRLHPLYGFSVTILNVRPEGEGTIRRAAELLQAKLAAEGLFAPERKRQLPYPPSRIGLITSTESAAYADFMKILDARWHGLAIDCVDVQVQGEAAPGQIVAALEYFNQQPEPPEVIVITRGGGSAEDLFAFNTEGVTRAVATSRAPTLVAIGHEVDVSLAELAADQRASTPSNAAELLVPDRKDVVRELLHLDSRLRETALTALRIVRKQLDQNEEMLGGLTQLSISRARHQTDTMTRLLEALNPRAILARGYAIVRKDGAIIRSRAAVKAGDIVDVELHDGGFTAAAA